MKLVKVSWYDAHSNDPWQDWPPEPTYLLMHTVGFIEDEAYEPGKLYALDDTLPVAATVTNEQSQCFNVLHIPLTCIRNVDVIHHAFPIDEPSS